MKQTALAYIQSRDSTNFFPLGIRFLMRLAMVSAVEPNTNTNMPRAISLCGSCATPRSGIFFFLNPLCSLGLRPMSSVTSVYMSTGAYDFDLDADHSPIADVSLHRYSLKSSPLGSVTVGRRRRLGTSSRSFLSRPASTCAQGGLRKKKNRPRVVFFIITHGGWTNPLCNQAHVYIRKYDIINTGISCPIPALHFPRGLAHRTKPFLWLYFQLYANQMVAVFVGSILTQNCGIFATG